jgi:hypothetical protein
MIFSENRFALFRIMPKRCFASGGMNSENHGSVFALVPTDSPAAIRRLGATGKVPV